jgi:hypothetical protein
MLAAASERGAPVQGSRSRFNEESPSGAVSVPVILPVFLVVLVSAS